MNLSQKVALNTIIQIVSKIITVIFGLLTVSLLTGYLGKEGYGDYMYIITLAVLFGAFADWGTATIGVREASKEKKEQSIILVNIFLVRLILALGAALFMNLVAFFLPIKSLNEVVVRQGIIFGSLILIIFTIKASFGVIFQTKLQMQKLAVADITASVLVFFISWLFIRSCLGLIPLIGAVVLANIFALSIAASLAAKTIQFKFQIDRRFIKKFINESLPMGAILLMFTVDNKIDTVMLGAMKGSGAVGVYALSYRIYDVLILGAAYLMNSLLPILSQYSDIEKWQKKLKTIYQKSFDILLVMGFIVLLVTLIFSPLIVRIITQQRMAEFFDSVFVLRILSLAIFLAYFNHLTGYTIVALGRQRLYFFVAFIALFFNIVANLIVIPKFSYYGAAGVTVLTEGLVLIITSLFVFRLIKAVPSITKFPETIAQLIKQKGRVF